MRGCDRYIHDGRALQEWLLQLVDDSSELRRVASKVIVDRFYMPEEIIMQAGVKPEAVVAQFDAEVRRTVNQPGFPSAAFVQKLIALSMALESKRIQNWKAQDQEDDEWHKEQSEKLGQNPTDVEVRRYLKRVCIRIQRSCRNSSDPGFDEPLETGITLNWVIGALGEELLPAAALLRHMLNETHQSYLASQAICRMGRAASEFYPELIMGLERDDPNSYFSKPLGILMRHDPSLILNLLPRIQDPHPRVRLNLITAFGHCGRETMRRSPEVEAGLIEHMAACPEDEWFAASYSLGELAVSSEAVNLLLAATFPPDGERTGAAIFSLGRIGLQPDCVVPRLIRLLDEFKETDPDWCYRGSHCRIVEALKGFGEHARSAIPSLTKRIWTEPQQYYDENHQLAERPCPDEAVIVALGSFGSAAKDALPLLYQVKAEMIRRGVAEGGSLGDDVIGNQTTEGDYCPEYLSEAIRKIESND